MSDATTTERWYVGTRDFFGLPGVVIGRAGDKGHDPPIAEVSFAADSPDVRRRAHLMAAAPEMFEALAGILEAGDHDANCVVEAADADESVGSGPRRSLRPDHAGQCDCWIGPARVALAKARGELSDG